MDFSKKSGIANWAAHFADHVPRVSMTSAKQGCSLITPPFPLGRMRNISTSVPFCSNTGLSLVDVDT